MKDILVVEDNNEERERLLHLFRDRGYIVVACDAVEKAEQSLAEADFRLVILDIGLGDKSGSYLFNHILAHKSRPQIVIFTGNPSVHLKERFLQSGAVDYIVKASPEAKNDPFMKRVEELIGEPQKNATDGIKLDLFVNNYVAESSRNLFHDRSGTFPACVQCGSRDYVVVFSHQPQLPPEVVGEIRCAQCGTPFEESVG